MVVDERSRRRGEPTLRWDSSSLREDHPMPADSTTGADFVLTLREPERALLLAMLKHELGETRVEAHHTDNPEYRESVIQREDVIRGLLARLQATQTK
jgi:hypothetical protein